MQTTQNASFTAEKAIKALRTLNWIV